LAVELLHDEGMMMLVVSIRNSGAHDQVTEDLHEAIVKISNSLGDESLYYRAIDPSGAWRLGNDEFNPWDDDAVGAWVRIASQSGALDGLRAWLAEVERLLASRLAENHESIWEAEDALLGEVPLSVLAIAHLEFVPIYARFRDLWEDGNATQQDSIVAEIVEAHGRCSEVEELLFKLVVHHGGDSDLMEYALRPQLEKLYGDFPKSKLFRRMVEAMHAMGSERKDSHGEWHIFSYHPSWPELTETAKAILAELEAG
jgi:hypothetical protein